MPSAPPWRLIHRDEPRSWEIAARVLADEAPGVIANKCGVAPDVLQCYEDLFFAVRARLHAWGWVCSRIIGGATWGKDSGTTSWVPYRRPSDTSVAP